MGAGSAALLDFEAVAEAFAKDCMILLEGPLLPLFAGALADEDICRVELAAGLGDSVFSWGLLETFQADFFCDGVSLAAADALVTGGL